MRMMIDDEVNVANGSFLYFINTVYSRNTFCISCIVRQSEEISS